MDKTFRFQDGRLVPHPIPEGYGDELGEALKPHGFVCEWKTWDNHATLYSSNKSGILRWMLAIGDEDNYALVDIIGWVNYFDAMRYFEPVIRLDQLLASQT